MRSGAIHVRKNFNPYKQFLMVQESNVLFGIQETIKNTVNIYIYIYTLFTDCSYMK